MGKLLNLSGKTFSRLTCIKRADNIHTRVAWICMCTCGNTTTVTTHSLRNSHVKSCGCIAQERPNAKTHGMTHSPEYSAWSEMKKRCTNKNTAKYHRYGGRGIFVCDEWRNSFVQFFNDMGKRPTKKHSLGRKDNNGGYTPENCQWESSAQQMNNMSTNRSITFIGCTMNLNQWAAFLNIKKSTLDMRLDAYKWPVEKAFMTPVKKH